MFFFIFSSEPGPVTERIFSIRDSRSPIPRSLDKNVFGLKLSKSFIFSPVVMKYTGAFVSAQAVRAPPPLAVESILVMITPEIETAD